MDYSLKEVAGRIKDLREAKLRPSLQKRMEVARRQLHLALEDKGEHIACLEARKHLAWYLRGVAYANYYKEKISGITSIEEADRIIDGICRDLK